MALAVMFYHFYSWQYTKLESTSVLAKLGVYAVSIFYILSGISLAIVYLKRTHFDAQSFIIKRIYRIFPLYIMAVIITVLIKLVASQISDFNFSFDFYSLIINLTLVFGFFSPGNYIPIGGWSIGNEVVFYCAFPFLALLIMRKKLLLFNSIVLLFFIIYCCFSFYFLNESLTDSQLWNTYVNPLNQIFLFSAGLVIGYYISPIDINKTIFRRSLIFISFMLLLLFSFYPISKVEESLIIGFPRLILTIIVISFVAVYFMCDIALTGILHKAFKWLGDCCYSIYLVHPLVYFPVSFVAGKLSLSGCMTLLTCLILTLFVSHYTYHFLESYFIKLSGQTKLSKKIYKG